MTPEAVSPLRQRMIEDMTIRQFGEKNRRDYIRQVREFTAFLGRSPDRAEPEDLRRYQLHLASLGASYARMNLTATALRFFHVTLGRAGFGDRMVAAAQLSDVLKTSGSAEQRSILKNLINSIELASEAVTITFNANCFRTELGAPADDHPEPIQLTLAIRLKRRGSELKLVLADRSEPARRDRTLTSRLALGYLWFHELTTGAVSLINAIAEREKVTYKVVRRYMDLAFLSIDLIEAILIGEQPVDLTTESVKRAYPLPIGWEEQKRLLGCC